MPINKKFLADLTPLSFFHIFNRTNNNELLFSTKENRIYFLKLIESRLIPLADIYAWCLIPNHFHFLIKTKSHEEAAEYLSQICLRKLTVTEKRFLREELPFASLLLRTWTSVFQSYSLAYNNMYKRKGNLFYTSFKRIKVEDESHFRRSVIYIHTNAVKHGLVEDFRDYEWSSWNSYHSSARSIIQKKNTYEIFGTRPAFLAAHEAHQDFMLRDNFPVL